MFISLPIRLKSDIKELNIDTGSEPEEGLEPESFAVDIRTLNEVELDNFYNLLKTQKDTRTARIHINAYKAALKSPKGAKVETLMAAAVALSDYIVTDAIEGWIFKVDDNPVAALVTGVDFYKAIKRRDYERDAYIQVRAIWNDRGSTESVSFNIEGQNTGGRTIMEMLDEAGWRKETPELHALYQEQLTRYKEMRHLFGKQLRLTSPRDYSKDDDDWGRRYYRSRGRKKKTTVDLMKDHAGRVVHDDLVEEGEIKISRYRHDDPDNPYIQPGMEATIERLLGKETKAFSRAPFHMLISVYHLGQHHDMDCHVADLEIYEYNKKIRESLILPEMYGEVLDVLTDNMLLIQEDIVKGKTGGSVILLAGPPGLGKTLTAEVYAEHREVPLLKIHSGQLGTDADTIEDRLLKFYQRAEKWGIPVLLDEFDVFGRARGDNLEQNAVVAVFLRTLEYQSNTIFLTTNRHDIMDDAILSRCSAIVAYQFPPEDELRDIWKTQRDQLLPTLSDKMIDELMEYFRTEKKQMSGRDVKNILRLADRYERTGRAIDRDLIITCAAFRGV